MESKKVISMYHVVNVIMLFVLATMSVFTGINSYPSFDTALGIFVGWTMHYILTIVIISALKKRRI